MQQFENLIGVNPWTAIFVLANTLLIFAVAKKYLFVPVHNMIQQRQQEIRDMYAAAEAEKSSAEDLKESSEARLSSARAEADEMIRSAVQTAQRKGETIIGEANLQASRIKQKADLKLSMGPMTFPHHLARIMVLEQLYRAEAIQAGSKYHK